MVGRVNCYLIDDDPLTLGDTGPNSGKALDELERALRELGRGGMSASDGALLLSRHFAEQLLAGAITPRAAAKAIARVRWKGRAEVDAELLAFERLDCAYEEAEESAVRRLFGSRRLDTKVRDEARRLLGR